MQCRVSLVLTLNRLAAFLVVVTLTAAQGLAATLPPGFAETVVATGLTNPTAMALAPDGRIFVCEQGGQLRIIDATGLLATPFVTVTVNSSGERGLLGVAFDPNFAFAANKYVYVYYTATTPAVHNRVSRFTANGNVGVPGSEAILLELDDLSTATNHNGGAIHFGVDGKLYIGVGENANGANAQTLSNLLGKMLRINADGTIPTDNPFYGQASGKNRAIWALGLRNPFTFALHPFSGRMHINDVGQNTYEEINIGIAGANYGWPQSEGPTMNPNHESPAYFYGHGSGQFTGCAIAGGAFYDPVTANFPSEYVGAYFFADLCTGWINQFGPVSRVDLRSDAAFPFATGISSSVDLKVGEDGRLYYLARGIGQVYKISYVGSSAPRKGSKAKKRGRR
jgi:glucose/arabinose dehydrogenase